MIRKSNSLIDKSYLLTYYCGRRKLHPRVTQPVPTTGKMFGKEHGHKVFNLNDPNRCSENLQDEKPPAYQEACKQNIRSYLRVSDLEHLLIREFKHVKPGIFNEKRLTYVSILVSVLVFIAAADVIWLTSCYPHMIIPSKMREIEEEIDKNYENKRLVENLPMYFSSNNFFEGLMVVKFYP